MGVSNLSDGHRGVLVATLLLANRSAVVDPAIEQLEEHVRLYRHRKLKERSAPLVSRQRAQAMTRSTLTARRDIGRLDRPTRRFTKKQLAGDEMHITVGAKRLADARSVLLELAGIGRKAAKRAHRKIRPGSKPVDEALSALSAAFGRIFYAATGELPRASRNSFPGKPEEPLDWRLLIPKVRPGAEAYALAAVFDAAGVKVTPGSLVYRLRRAKAAAKEERAQERQQAPPSLPLDSTASTTRSST